MARRDFRLRGLVLRAEGAGVLGSLQQLDPARRSVRLIVASAARGSADQAPEAGAGRLCPYGHRPDPTRSRASLPAMLWRRRPPAAGVGINSLTSLNSPMPDAPSGHCHDRGLGSPRDRLRFRMINHAPGVACDLQRAGKLTGSTKAEPYIAQLRAPRAQRCASFRPTCTASISPEPDQTKRDLPCPYSSSGRDAAIQARARMTSGPSGSALNQRSLR